MNDKRSQFSIMNGIINDIVKYKGHNLNIIMNDIVITNPIPYYVSKADTEQLC